MHSRNRIRFSSGTEDSLIEDKSRQNSFTPKRSTRIRSKPKKYGDMELTPTKRRSLIEYESSEEEDVKRSCTEKPTALFCSDDVDGQDIFKFKSRHTKNDLQNIVKAAVSNSPLMTPSKSRTSRLLSTTEATPRHVTDIIKKRIKREVQSESSESDFSDGSSSDFVPDKSYDESDSSSAPETAEEKEEESNEENEKSSSHSPQKVQIVNRKDNRTRPKDSEYVVTPDNYFLMHSSKKITTSDHTLARLKNMNLNDENETIYISKEHEHKIADLVQSYEHLFDRWLYVLSENFNVILYGVGSKRGVLQQFQAKNLNDQPCIVINGFFPSLTIRSILETIVIDLLENSRVPSNIGDTIDLIDSQLLENNVDLFLIVHNIDGDMLRNSKSQAILASLAQLKNVHMIATIDHINAPLLWDCGKLSKLRWTWWDVTTFEPYAQETAQAAGSAARGGGALQLASLAAVHRSLTANARGIYNLIVRHQLHHHKQQNYQGLPFKDLYSKCREQFLVSSDLALRAQLTEFLDHKLVKIKRTYDGGENYIIPIDSSLLQQFLEEQDN
ncbi:PREDICTED: origin recognition complex subunit 2 [Papilio xuthus]|uniref:Origin recognition complex subunit 2 n=1 Tax=Papilio xuthus TaxID=66420 RepID=A0AAJ7E6G4_PAPXU|nr:PREDICTED: origin recognition complex subunit 2 [Papilio xuthus]